MLKISRRKLLASAACILMSSHHANAWLHPGSALSGNVELIGTQISSGSATNLPNLIDGNPATVYGDSSSSSWVGVDMGSPVNFVGYLFTPERGDSTTSNTNPALDYPLQLNGVGLGTSAKTIDISNDPTFSTGVTTVDTFPLTQDYPQNDLSMRTISGTARCARINSPFAHMAELYFLAQYVPGLTSARPMRVSFSPWGGLFPAGSTTMTLSCGTAGTQIFYTTDGSTPDKTKTRYIVPFSLSISGSVTIKAIAYDPTGVLSSSYSVVTQGIYNSAKIAPLQDQYDVNRGILIEAHAGNIIDVGPITGQPYLYWCGQMTNMRSDTNFGFSLIRRDYGVNLYRCTNDESNPGYLKQWTFIGQILPQPSNPATGTLWPVCERPKIVWNANTSKFVLCAHLALEDFSANLCGIAESSSIESGWSWFSTNFNPSGTGAGFKDCGFYTNAANTLGYLVYTGQSGGNNLGMFITKLDSAFHAAVSTNTVDGSTSREAPILFDNGTNLFLITSKAYAYNASGDADVQYAELSGLDPMQTWGSLTGSGRVFNTNPAGGNYLRSQCAFVFKPAGKSQYVLASDLWFCDSATLVSSRQAWSPLTITATTITATQPASWDIGDLS